MQTQVVSGSTQQRLARSAAVLSARAANQIRKITKQQAKEVAQRRAELAAAAAAEARLTAKQNVIRAKRLVLARKGLERLLTLGATKEIQNILVGQSRLNRARCGIKYSEGVRFYMASRLAGDLQGMTAKELEGEGTVPTRDVTFRFREEALEVEWGNSTADLVDCYQLFYKPRQHEGVEFQVEVSGCFQRDVEEERSTLSAFLEELGTFRSVNMGAIRSFYQREDEWEPEIVAFQLLVSCGRKRSFEAYLGKCLENIESSAG